MTTPVFFGTVSPMEELTTRLAELRKKLNIEHKRDEISELKVKMQDDSVWQNWEEGQKVSQDLASLQKDVEDYEMLELIAEEGNESEFEKEIKKQMENFLTQEVK